jgi:transcriptional regulator with XRE-family HTH domain
MSLSDAQRMTSRAGHAIDPTFLSRWERGERIPTLANVLVMAHVLHVSIQELLTDPPEEES